jgi:uncharacterized membrane protein
MRSLVVMHVVAGTLSLLSGYAALYAAKGAAVHRRSGTLFVLAMLVMCVAGALLAALRDNEWSVVNLSAAVTTAYLVITSLVTVRRPPGWTRRLDAGLAALALAVGITMLSLGTLAVQRGGSLDGVPAFPFFLFGVIGTLGGAGDVRMLRSEALQGARRLTRHLWRMSFALLVAAMSFFFGQARVIPRPIRIMPLLAVPVVAVLVTMLYWLWRVRWKRSLRGVVTARMAKAA